MIFMLDGPCEGEYAAQNRQLLSYKYFGVGKSPTEIWIVKNKKRGYRRKVFSKENTFID